MEGTPAKWEGLPTQHGNTLSQYASLFLSMRVKPLLTHSRECIHRTCPIPLCVGRHRENCSGLLSTYSKAQQVGVGIQAMLAGIAINLLYYAVTGYGFVRASLLHVVCLLSPIIPS
tara:strand:- start:2679 stop:3026 length:348 start_codon:yes stop_codon:yes gene_type:complete